MAKRSTEKQLVVRIVGADRQLWAGGTVRIVVRDIFAGRDIQDEDTSASLVRLKIELPFDAGQIYGLRLVRPNHRTAWSIVTQRTFMGGEGPGQTEQPERIVSLMLLPNDASSFDLAGGFGRLVQRSSPFTTAGSGLTSEQYLQLDQPSKMAFLNLESKLRETLLDGTPALDFVQGIQRVKRDRVYLLMREETKARVGRLPEFGRANGHGVPEDDPDLPGHPDSWKHTRFDEGNVQLSFSHDTVPVTTAGSFPVNCYSVDVDIDLARGLGHAAEYLRNNVFEPGHKTDQRDVYALLFAQGILPVYTIAQIEHRIAA